MPSTMIIRLAALKVIHMQLLSRDIAEFVFLLFCSNGGRLLMNSQSPRYVRLYDSI